MAEENVETSEAEVAVHWKEEGLVYPTTEFVAQANMTDEGIYERFSLDNFPNCFKEYATFWIGTSTGTPPWTPATPPVGSGS